jgi:hypothetical protein
MQNGSFAKPLPVDGNLADALQKWRQHTKYRAADDWVFASPASNGRKTYWGTVHHAKSHPSCLRGAFPGAMCCGNRAALFTSNHKKRTGFGPHLASSRALRLHPFGGMSGVLKLLFIGDNISSNCFANQLLNDYERPTPKALGFESCFPGMDDGSCASFLLIKFIAA